MARSSAWAKSSRLMTAAAVIVVVAALYFGRDVLIPLAMALLFSFLLAPLVTFLERLRLPRAVAVMLVVIFAFGVLGATGWIVGGQLRSLAHELPRYQGNVHRKVEALQAPGTGIISRGMEALHRLGREFSPASGTSSRGPSADSSQAAPASGTIAPSNGGNESPAAASPGTTSGQQPPQQAPIPVEVVAPSPSPIRFLSSVIAPLLSPLATAGIVVVFCIFMLIQREDLRDRVIRLVGQGQLTLTTQALDDAAQRISRYLLMQFLVNSVYGILVALGLWLIGLPNAFLWGLLTSILRFLPYIGTWIAASLPILLAFAVDPGWIKPLETIALFGAIEVATYNVIEPLLYGSSTGMSALAVLVAAIFWAWLWGPVGLLLSTPLTVCLVVIGKYVPQLAFLDVLLGDEPVLDPPTRVYQRLLAWDAEEAAELVEEHVQEHSLADAYDGLLVPALAMAEADHHRGEVDDGRLRFVQQSIRDIVEDLGESERAEAAAKAPAQPRPAPPPAPEHPAVICLPAADESDEIVTTMLVQLLQLDGLSAAEAISAKTLASEMLDLVAQRNPALVCISAMPPAGVGHARYLCKRLQPHFPQERTIVGLWTAKADPRRIRRRVGCSETAPIATSLRDCLLQVRQLTPTFAAATAPPERPPHPDSLSSVPSPLST